MQKGGRGWSLGLGRLAGPLALSCTSRWGLTGGRLGEKVPPTPPTQAAHTAHGERGPDLVQDLHPTCASASTRRDYLRRPHPPPLPPPLRK